MAEARQVVASRIADGQRDRSQVVVAYLGLDTLRMDAIEQSASRLIAGMFGNSDSAEHCECVWPLIDAVWPARSTNAYRELPRDRVKLTLMPLSRIGQMEGKSGSVVLIGCFSDSQNADIPPSHPLIVKTAPKSAGKLQEEYSNALTVRPFAYEHKDEFSIPFRKDSQGDFDVLWSLFSASGPLWHEPDHHLDSVVKWKINDLRDLLQKDDTRAVSSVLHATYATMRNFHVPFGHRRKRRIDVVTEYQWYLRGLGSVWGEEWEPVFGPATAAATQFAAKQWTNPMWLVSQLNGLSCDLSIGAVHGDLHPGNIVIASGNRPRIIDFGWAQDDAHVAKDFALMECNLRFLFLRPQLASDEVERFATWVQWDDERPVELGGYCSGRCDVIEDLRGHARAVLGSDADWDREYLLPLFFVAFGLLRFAPQLGNQYAAILTVLALATHLERCGLAGSNRGAVSA